MIVTVPAQKGLSTPPAPGLRRADGSSPHAPAERGGKEDREGNQSNHPPVFLFHGGLLPSRLLGFLNDDHGFLFSPIDLSGGGGGHFSLEAQGPHHDDAQDPPGDLPRTTRG